jgi:hypothetical protein
MLFGSGDSALGLPVIIITVIITFTFMARIY